jgi:transcriptional repressor NF-X1
LTRHETNTSAAGSSHDGQLNVEASEFTPGAPFTSTPLVPQQNLPSRTRKARRMSASSAPDISTRIHDDIGNRVYECSICTNSITRRDKIWSCHTCWSVLHLNCVKKWSTKSLAAAAASQHGDEHEKPQTWRCPGCNLPTDVMPTSFRCWCEKETDPVSLPGLPPFSCGQTCNRARPCPHACSTMCHAGSCEPCPHMGPTQSCFCGREDKTRKCLATDYTNGWSCGQVCNEVMPCGEHYCGRPCHEGLCGACEVPVEATCYCGQDHSVILCCDREDEVTSKREETQEDGTVDIKEWLGTFNCGNACNREFDCGKHRCEQPCHSQDQQIPHCPRAPDVVSHCPCGKTSLEDILSQPRTSCEDEIPICSKPCSKDLPCGHICKRICHSGDCYPCLSMTDIACRCGKTTTETMCHQGTLEPPSCLRICRATLNCGRHECGEHCCPGERKAADRIANRKKIARILNTSSLGPDHNFEAEHICTRVCGKALKCGNHTCPELCHRGPCNSCREAIFEEISCDCGKTVLQPPLPCGTQPPPCRFDCERTKTCGHPQVAHPCHGDNESCPKCPFLTTKACSCGKNKLKNQPCGLDVVRCGEVCGKKIK